MSLPFFEKEILNCEEKKQPSNFSLRPKDCLPGEFRRKLDPGINQPILDAPLFFLALRFYANTIEFFTSFFDRV